MDPRKLFPAVLPAAALILLTAVAEAQAPAAAPPPSAPPAGAQPAPAKKPGFLKAYKFRPMLYWGAGLGLNILPARNNLCPDNTTCVGSPAGFGFSLDMGARFHYLVGLELTYDAFFFSKASSYYNQATWQSVRLDARIYVLAGANIEVYIMAGGGVNFFGDKFDVDSTGGGFEAGVGIDFVPSQAFTVGAQVLYRGSVFKSFCPEYADCVTSPSSRVSREFMHGVLIMVNLQFRYIIVGAS
ncbi:MAG: hypothetical protein JRG91_08005 [Deltaproteobacteria bacterium]|nr:hypothetical protein [Deltaproteobacteria bacterium]